MANVLTDHDVAVEIARRLQRAGHQAVTARDLGLSRASNAELLLIAAKRGPVLVTHNGSDFAMLHDGWLRWSADWNVRAHHAGILVLPQPTAAERARGQLNSAELTRLVHELLATGSPESNELWRWHRGVGWVRGA